MNTGAPSEADLRHEHQLSQMTAKPDAKKMIHGESKSNVEPSWWGVRPKDNPDAPCLGELYINKELPRVVDLVRGIGAWCRASLP